MKILLLYLPIINALAFLLMLIDKQKAKKNRWRIPENTLLGICCICGSLGGFFRFLLVWGTRSCGFRHRYRVLGRVFCGLRAC